MLFCCKLRPIVFNFPFRRNQFLPERHFSGSLANLSELICDFLDPLPPLVGWFLCPSFLSNSFIHFYGIRYKTSEYCAKQRRLAEFKKTRRVVTGDDIYIDSTLQIFDPLRICESTGKAPKAKLSDRVMFNFKVGQQLLATWN